MGERKLNKKQATDDDELELYSVDTVQSDVSTSSTSSADDNKANSNNTIIQTVAEKFFKGLGHVDADADADTDHDHVRKPRFLRRLFTDHQTDDDDDTLLPQDKGYAWVMVAVTLLAVLSSWGCNAAFGVFLSFFLSNDTFPNATKYDYALISGFPLALGQGMAPFSLILMRIIGIKQTMLFGTALMLAGFLWASFATHLWELYVSQGVLIGISIAFVVNPPITCIPGWFEKKRAAANGIIYSGTGLGGLVYGLSCNKMLQDNGNSAMCYRMLAIACTCSCLISICLIKERIPTKPIGFKSKTAILQEFNKFFNMNIIKNPTVLLIAMWYNLATFAYCLMTITLSSYAVARGMSQHQGSILTSVLNAGQVIGRPSMGILGDRFGRVNVTNVLTSLLCIYVFSFWIPAHTFIQMVIFSIMMGLSVGVASMMYGVLVADLVEPQQFLPAWGFVTYSGSPLFLVSELIAQALTVPEMKKNPYIHTQIFTGFCFFGALLLSILLRERAVTIKLRRSHSAIKEKLKDAEDTESLSEASTKKPNGDDELDITAEDDEIDTTIDSGDDALSQWEIKDQKYNYLLGPGWKKMLKRMTYKAKV
ncbi:hypothetical protein MOSE0_A02718 [Monosporozyma servazzii]